MNRMLERQKFKKISKRMKLYKEYNFISIESQINGFQLFYLEFSIKTNQEVEVVLSLKDIK